MDGETGWGATCLIQGHNDKVAEQGRARLPKGGRQRAAGAVCPVTLDTALCLSKLQRPLLF